MNNKKLLLYIVVAIVLTLIAIILIKDYQQRMVIHNANYQCMYGNDQFCNYLQEREMRQGEFQINPYKET